MAAHVQHFFRHFQELDLRGCVGQKADNY